MAQNKAETHGNDIFIKYFFTSNKISGIDKQNQSLKQNLRIKHFSSKANQR